MSLVLAACGSDDDGNGTQASDEADAGAGDTDVEAEAAPEGQLEGELISLVIPFSTGGGYDQDGRLLAPYLGDALGADVVVENEPGAGGLLAFNRISQLPGDGTTLAIANGPGLGGAHLGGAEGLEFDPADLTAIGRMSFDPKVMVVGGQTDYETLDDVMADPTAVRFGATGPGASSYVDIVLLMSSLGVPVEDLDIVTGFDGGSDVEAAIVAGEIDAMVSSVSGRLPLIDSGDLRPIVVADREPYEGLEDVPLLIDVDGIDGEQAEILEGFLNHNDLGRPLLGPPDMPDDIIAELRAAFEQVMTDPDFQEQADTQGRDIAFLTGEEYDELLDGLDDAPPAFVEVLEQASAEG